MPTILRIGRLRVVIYPNDHVPEHVHVIGPEEEAVFVLHCEEGGPPTVRENYGFSRRELTRIAGVLMEQLEMLCDRWEEIHDSE
jgi:Domain of unknown function (DUF4160)